MEQAVAEGGKKMMHVGRRTAICKEQAHRENQEQQADVPSRRSENVCQQSHSGHDTKKAAPYSFRNVVLPSIIFAVKLANSFFE